MLPVDDLTTWAQGLSGWPTDIGRPVPAKPGPFIPGKPDRIVVVTPVPGGGLTLEGMFESPAFQVRCRGAGGAESNGYESAEQLAKQVDDLLLSVGWPLTIGTRHVTRLDRSGSGPSFLTRDPAGRHHFTCVYMLTVARLLVTP